MANSPVKNLIPAGGLINYVLAKLGPEDFNMGWIAVASGGGTWGSITGTVTNQTDLINYLAATYEPIFDFAASFNSAFSSKDTDDLAEGSNLYFTNERVDDRVASFLQAGTNIGLVYDDPSNTLTINSTASALDLVSYSYAGGF